MKLYLAENLKKLRQSKAITQEQLAESLGVSFQSVIRWETGGFCFGNCFKLDGIDVCFYISNLHIDFQGQKQK